MSFFLECKKIRRTGFLPAFLGSGIIGALIPVLNMAVRSELYVSMNTSPIRILLNANWRIMAMLNILIIVTGASIMYNTEYADNAIQKMCSLPTKEITIFFGKAAVMTVVSIMVLVIEAISIFFCTVHWFEQTTDEYIKLLQNIAFFFLLMFPVILISLSIASACRNMWISLGIGVICVFLATILPGESFIFSLFPYCLPFQVLSDYTAVEISDYIMVGITEIVAFSILETLFLKIRRTLR